MTGVAPSPTGEILSEPLQWHYNVSSVSVPTLLLSRAGSGDQNIMLHFESRDSIYRHLTAAPFKVMGCHKDADHSQMVVYAGGHVAAWMMWQLQGDTAAAHVVADSNPEIAKNRRCQDVKPSQMQFNK